MHEQIYFKIKKKNLIYAKEEKWFFSNNLFFFHFNFSFFFGFRIHLSVSLSVITYLNMDETQLIVFYRFLL